MSTQEGGAAPEAAAVLHEQAQALLDAAPDGMLLVDGEGRIVAQNRRAEALFGYRADGLTGRSVEDLVPAELRRVHVQHREEFARHPVARPMGEGRVLYARREDGSTFPVEVSLSPMLGAQPGYVIAAIRDASQRQAVAQERMLLLHQAEAAEARYRALLESAPDSFIAIGSNGRIVLVNRQTELLFGYRRDELLGQSVETLIPERFHHVHEEHRTGYALAPRARPMGHAGLQLFGRHRDGREFPVEVSLSPVHDGDDTFIMAAIRDISERRRAEDEIRLLQSVTQAISEAPDLDSALALALERVCDTTGWDFGQAWMPRADGRTIEVTGAWYSRVEGMEPFRAASVGRTFPREQGLAARVWATARPIWMPDVQHEQSFIRAAAAAQVGIVAGLAVPVLSEREVVAVLEFFQRRPRGEDARLLSTVSAVAAQLGAMISRRRAEEEVKRTAEALAQQTMELARSNADLEQFAYVASHDLQEPLRMVASYTQLLQRRYRDRLDDDANEFISFAVDGATRMQRLINDLLAYSRVGTRGNDLVPTDANAALQDVLTDLEMTARESGAEMSVDPLPTVRADPVQLRQLFQNLIGNAIKFHGEQPPRVHVSAERQGEQWRFVVRDNGIGIAPEYAERIFVIFQRLHNRAEYPGTGIGLAICKKIVERHGGRIWLESTPGQGSAFSFTLPAA